MPRKLTKILATISSNNCSQQLLLELHNAGMDAVRLNTAHMTTEDALHMVRQIRATSDRIGILIDTKGPEVRTREIEKPIPLEAGETVRIVRSAPTGKAFCMSYPQFIDDVPEGAMILIEDGTMELEIVQKNQDDLVCIARNAGHIAVKKNVNVPSVRLNLPSLSGRDEEFIRFAARYELDFIAHSFVRNRADIQAVQDILNDEGSSVKIISKIENTEGVENLDDILDASAGVMIARGDLGVEVPFERLPIIQKRIIQACAHKAKIVITATQMLHSMIENPRPTRAEVSDVANAVFDGTDVLMLSGETANGKYPVEAVNAMAKIACEAETQRASGWNMDRDELTHNKRAYFARTAAHAYRELPVKAIIADSETGRIARLVSSYRPPVTIYVKSPDIHTVRELSLTYGVHAQLQSRPTSTDQLISQSVTSLLRDGALEAEDVVVVVGGTPGLSGSTNFLVINTVAHCLQDELPA
ncbi:MAG: pyruvate kinase [Methylomonas sp.]